MNQKSRDKAAPPQLAGSVLRAILTGDRYPDTLFTQVQLRIRAEHALPYTKAAIIKAYLMRNTNTPKEVLQVELNEQSAHPAYLLGRLFSVL